MSQLITGSSLPKLQKELCSKSSITCTPAEISTFPNQELKIRIEPQTTQDAVLLQSFSIPVHSNIVEYLLLADAIKRSGVKHLTSVVPWFGYSKQDRVFRPGEPLSVKVIARMIQAVKVDKLITLDLHNQSIAGYFDIPVVNLSAQALFIEHAKSHQKDNQIVVSPDAGSVKKSNAFANELGLDVVYMNKSRDLETGTVSYHGFSKNIAGKNIIMYDDMIATGSTLIAASNALKDHGANQIDIYATHHLYIPEVQDKLANAPIDNLIVTNSIESLSEQPANNLTILSITPLLLNELNVS